MRLIDADALPVKFWYGRFFRVAEIDIDNAPTVDAIKHGYWKGKPIAGYSDVGCSECGGVFLENNGKWNYCPNCGARMDGNK